MRHIVKGGRQRTAPITYLRKNVTEGIYSKPVLTKEQILKITRIETPKDTHAKDRPRQSVKSNIYILSELENHEGTDEF